MNIFRSLAKSWKLLRISADLDQPSARSVDEIFEQGSRREAAEEKLLDLVETTLELRQVMLRFGATRATLHEAFQTLETAGAAQRVRGHYVAASALAFVPTLDFVLGRMQRGLNDRDSTLEMAYKLVQYFERGEVGAIRDDNNDEQSRARRHTPRVPKA